MIGRLVESAQPVTVQDTTLARDVLGRYVCNTIDEAWNNGGLPFDAVVIGAGMFGAYCAEKIYRRSNLRVLVLEAGPFLVSEHVQNLARIGINAGPAVTVASDAQDPGTRELVWGSPWRSNVAFPGLAYCVGGRSLYWGGWAPRLTAADLAAWPPAVAGWLQGPDPTNDAYHATERETGVAETTDYISGPLFAALRAKFVSAVFGVPGLDAIEAAPLAVQGSAPASGLFAFDKFSSAPILVDAIREAASVPDGLRRLFLVPRAHVVRLHASGGAVDAIEVDANGTRHLLPIRAQCAVVLASSTIESTRLAMTSFPTPLMGRNLMSHLRSNLVVRIKRSELGSALPSRLEAAALLVRGSTAAGRFHFQVTAAAVPGANSEVDMWRMIPDIDLLDAVLASQTADRIVITLRGIGESVGDRNPAGATITGAPPSWMNLSPDQVDEFGAPRAWVNLAPTPADTALWDAMDAAAVALAKKLVSDGANLEFFHGGSWHATPPPPGAVRDGLGTTHHEAGTLWMGSDPATSVTNVDGRFHHLSNAYVAGPALFPTLGSANPSLTALSLARRTASAIATAALAVEPGFVALGSGGLAGWQIAGAGGFIELGANIVESVGGIGLLWYTAEEFEDFVLRVDWRATNRDDNSGIFIRFPRPGNADPANDWKIAVDRGYEIQIDDTGRNADRNPPTFGDPSRVTGAIYNLAPASSVASHPLGSWNAFEITARGNEISVTLNGVAVSRLVNADRSPRGFIGLQNHHAGSTVQFRNLRIKSLVAPSAAAIRTGTDRNAAVSVGSGVNARP